MRRAARVLRIAAAGAVAGWVYARERWRLRREGPGARPRAAGRALRRLCLDLGATFIKGGQILSSRADLLPAELLDELCELQDRVPPFPVSRVRETIERELGRAIDEVFEHFEDEPAAAGSVAQVHRATLRSSGEDVAVKVLRPDVASRIALDVAILRGLATFAERLRPSLRYVSLREAADELAVAIEGQIDLEREARAAARFRASFAGDPDIVIPRTFAEASARSVLTLEWLDGLPVTEIGPGTSDVHATMRAMMRLVGRAAFVHGFVHADPHPGNLRFRPPAGLVLLDYGLTAELGDHERREFARWGFALATGDGKTFARILYEQAPHSDVRDYAAFEAELCAMVDDLRRITVRDFPVVSELGRLFDILRRHRVQAGAHLTTVYLAMVSMEGLVKRLAPEVRLFEEALPFMAEGLGLLPAAVPEPAPSEPAPAPPAEPDAFAAGRYRPVRLLGEGSRKRVHLARDETLERDVALGVLKPEAMDAASLDRFRLEAQVMAKLGDHPGIVAVYDFGLDSRVPYVVSEHMAGGTLAELLEGREGRPLPVVDAIRTVTELCGALEHAHKRGVVHRDVKPANVWLTADGTAKLGDFGLATTTAAPAPRLVGTVAYMSPEQALGKPADARSDLYSLGCVLYELLTGDVPFPGNDTASVIAAHLGAAPPPPSAKNPDVDPELDRLTLACLAKRAGERPASAAALAAALASLSSASPRRASAADRRDIGLFVGRDRELRQLRAGLDDVFAGRGRLFLLAGEPGIGKTRTAAQLALEARRRGARVLLGRCHEGEGAPAFWPWLQILCSYVSDRDPDALASEMGEAAPQIAQFVPEARERLPHVSPTGAQEGEAARFRLFDALTCFLRAAARARPLVLVLDDVHWADKSSLLLLQFLAREMDTARLLVVATYRDVEVLHGHALAEILPSLRRSAAHERIRLRGLAERDVGSLLEAIGGHEMPAELVRAIHRETEGNPFFAEEILSHLLEEELLRWDGERWVGDRRSCEISLPESVREVIGRRVARLSARCREFLTLASVIGREFDVGVIAHLAAVGHEEIHHALAEATGTRVVSEVPRMLGRFRFAHALIREALYGALSTAERVLLHRRIGDTLERLHADAIEAHLAELAYHFGEAAPGGDVEKAVTYAVRAAERANAQLAFEEAARGYERALATLALGAPAEGLRRCRLLLRLGEARFNGGDFERSKETFLTAAEAAEALGAAEEFARAAIGYGGLALVVFELTQVPDRLVALLEKALVLLGERESPIRAEVMARLAVSLWDLEDRPRRLALAREALAMAERVCDPNAYTRVLLAATFVTWSPDNIDERLRLLEEAAQPRTSITDPAVRFLVDAWRVWALADAGDYLAASRVLEQISHRPEAGRGYFRWMKCLMDAAQAQYEGRFDDALRLNAEARALGEEMRSRDSVILTGVQSLFLRWLRGGLDEGFDDSVAFIGDAISRWSRGRARGFLSALADPDSGRREFQAVAERGFETLPRDFFWSVELYWMAQAARRFDDVDSARAIYDLVRSSPSRGLQGFVAWFGSISHTLGELAAMLGRWDEADRHFERSAADALRTRGRPWLAVTQLAHARMLAARGAPGDRERAARLVTEAIDGARALGMKSLLDDGIALRLELEGVAAKGTSGSIGAVVASLDQRRPDFRAHSAPDGTVTLLVSEVDAVSEWIERLGDQRALERVGAAMAIVRGQARAHGGFEVEAQNDGFLLAFASAERAVACAVEIQRALAARAAGDDDAVRMRIGLHIGEVLKEGDRFFGRSVILAARIAAHARGGQILVSAPLRAIVEERAEIRFGEEQEVTLPGFTRSHPLSPVAWSDAEEPASAAGAGAPEARGSAGEAVFRRSGDVWALAYDGKTLSLRDAKGLRYIARLLGEPGRELHVLDLVGEASGPEAPLAIAGNAGEVIDLRAKAAYKARLDDLRGELEEAEERGDAHRAGALREEIEAIARELSAAYGLGGRARKAGDVAERARKAVQSRISTTIARIRKDHPTLALHLGNSIRLGTFCVYDAEKAPDWQL